MLQRHAVPVKPASTWPGGAAMGPIEYYLSFLEFQENGRAAQKGLDGSALQRSQLDVPEEHLTRHNGNYVIVFVHGPQPIASPILYTWQTRTSRIKPGVSSCRRY